MAERRLLRSDLANGDAFSSLAEEDDPYKEFDKKFLHEDELIKGSIEAKREKESIKASCLKDVEEAEQRRLHPINFDCIIGHEDLKEEICFAVIAKIKHNEASKEYHKQIGDHATTGILAYGLPGVGKSEILKCLLDSLKDHPDIDCKHIDCSELQGNPGNNAEKINSVFDDARSTTKKVCIIVIDEIDSVMLKKGKFLNATERTNAMQSNLDGVKDSSKIIVIATTNRVNNMESASLSRFTRIDLELPTLDERKQLIKKFISPLPINPEFNDMHIDIMAKDTEGFTGRNFRDIGLKLDRIRVITDKPIDFTTLIKEQNKFRARAGKINMHIEGDE